MLTSASVPTGAKSQRASEAAGTPLHVVSVAYAGYQANCLPRSIARYCKRVMYTELALPDEQIEHRTRFLPKVRTFVDWTASVKDDSLVVFVDQDVLMLRDIDLDRDLPAGTTLGHVYRPDASGQRLNTGVLVFRMTPLIRKFLVTWFRRTCYWCKSNETATLASDHAGGTDQMAFNEALTYYRGSGRQELDYRVWNLCQDFGLIDSGPQPTIFLHLKGKHHKLCLKGDFTSVTPRVQELWHETMG